ncbi:MAG: hypothetical protein ACK5I7_03555, partial [Anaerotignum sp.]
MLEELLIKVKENLILTHEVDDEMLKRLIATSISYAESYQHLECDTTKNGRHILTCLFENISRFREPEGKVATAESDLVLTN